MVSRNIIGFETFALSPQISDKKYGNMHIMVWCPESWHFFLISRDPVTSAYFQKPMFVLKPWAQASCFEYHEAHKRNKTSPPSARVAAMRFMLQQNCKTKLHWKILETPLKLFIKFSWSTLDTFFNTLGSSLKHFWNYLKTPFELLLDTLRFPWITLKRLSVRPSIFLETSLKHLPNFLKYPFNFF